MLESNRTVTLGVVLALTVLAMPSVSFADSMSNTGSTPYTVGDGWHTFSWTGSITNQTPTQNEMAFAGSGPVQVKITDAFVSGDQFKLFDNGHLVGPTTLPNGTGPWNDNPNTAFTSGIFSTGVFDFGAGSHLFTLQLFNHPTYPTAYYSGSAFIRFDGGGNGGNGGVSSVDTPEPGTLALVGLGLAGLAAGRVRRRFRKSPEAAIA